MKVYSFRSDEELVQKFQNKYFGLMSKYLNKCLEFALKSEHNFFMVMCSAEKHKGDKHEKC